MPAKPRQIEFARLNLTYTVMSKRKLLELVQEGHVSGLGRSAHADASSAMRRRGYTPEAIRAFCERIGVAKRENLDRRRAARARGARGSEQARAARDGRAASAARRDRELSRGPDRAARRRQQPGRRRRPARARCRSHACCIIEQDDFREDPPKKFFRLAPGREVRLRCAYFITCTGVVKDPATGEVTELRCTYDPATRGGDAPDGRKVKATLHWVSAAHAVDAEVRLYDRLFKRRGAGQGSRTTATTLNPASLEVVRDAKVEPSAAAAAAGTRFQFERLGYFCVDPDSRPGAPVFNRTVTLKDSWARIEQDGSCRRRYSR